MQNLLVCGSTGFIGRNVAEHLAGDSSFKVFGQFHDRPPLDDRRIEPIRANLADAGQVASALEGMDVVIQAAATTSGAKDIVQQPHLHVTDNAVMNSLILRAAYDLGVSHVIYFSCSVMYPPSDRPVKEEDFRPEGIHPAYFGAGWTKVYVEQMCRFYADLGRARYTVIRHSNIYGRYDKFDLERSHVFGATVAKVMKGRARRIVLWGDGTEARDLLYIDDLLDFVDAALSRQKDDFELVNVAYGDTVSVENLAEKIIRAADKTLVIERDFSKPTINVTISLDISKARDRFGWSPNTSLEEGISKTLSWYRQNVMSPTVGAPETK
jgi:nucleoside-diphosphate-sugar epimerase